MAFVEQDKREYHPVKITLTTEKEVMSFVEALRQVPSSYKTDVVSNVQHWLEQILLN